MRNWTEKPVIYIQVAVQFHKEFWTMYWKKTSKIALATLVGSVKKKGAGSKEKWITIGRTDFKRNLMVFISSSYTALTDSEDPFNLIQSQISQVSNSVVTLMSTQNLFRSLWHASTFEQKTQIIRVLWKKMIRKL